MKNFEVPTTYKSSIISKIKSIRKLEDKRKKNFSPTIIDLGKIQFYIARHFGFCFGVEHAIEIAYETVRKNKNKRIFLLSEMIHNPKVNADLVDMGIKFIMNTNGSFFINWNELTKDDVVIIPAFGTTIEIEEKLKSIGINPHKYNTTCPFVEKVWSRSKILGAKEASVIIHGKYKHEETRATFSHSSQFTKAIVVKNINEAKKLGDLILGKSPETDFEKYFENRFTKGMSLKDFNKIGIINQTTMLAKETEEISDYFLSVMIEKYGEENIKNHFIDSRDTLCYATNDNQNAAKGLLNTDADLAIVVGGYNSSNTSHLVELLDKKFDTYFISSGKDIISKNKIKFFDLSKKEEVVKEFFLPQKDKIKIALTSGASCPDSVVDEVIFRLAEFFQLTSKIENVEIKF